MPVTTTYPGVYIEEEASPSISVSTHPTAMPVFIGQFISATSTAFTSGKCIRIANWLEFTATCSLAAMIAVTITSTAPEDGGEHYTYTDTETMGNSALYVQHYFQNGGGPCYILPLINPSDTAELEALPNAIAKENDITLIVSAYGSTAEQTNVYTNINSLLTGGDSGNRGYFLIADSADGSAAPATQATQTAVYYPYLNTALRSTRPADTAIAVTGYKDTANSEGTEITTLALLKTANADLYGTISQKIDSLIAAPVALSPCAAMAGIYCTTDAKRGVWKAPANVVVNATSGPTVLVSDATQGTMNSKGINVIRQFIDRGTVAWGARTLAGADTNSDTSWRYIPVRRLFNSAERDIKTTLQALVFEPNNAPTWEAARGAIDNYLYSLWQQGALAGSTPEEAYFVKIGEGTTMTADEIAQGKMIVQVGMAAARPAEFIILQFTQDVIA